MYKKFLQDVLCVLTKQEYILIMVIVDIVVIVIVIVVG